ncbi:MAG: hypothetical protein ACTSQ7_01555 [Alphaproteobacteria bacterium]
MAQASDILAAFFLTHFLTATELYLVLGGAESRPRRPLGAVILHSSRIGHAMRTVNSPTSPGCFPPWTRLLP